MEQTFDQQYTAARAQMEGEDWILRKEIADLQAENAKLRAKFEEIISIMNKEMPYIASESTADKVMKIAKSIIVNK